MAKKPAKAKTARKGRGGRNEFQPTAAQREQVEILAAARVSEDQIARAIGIARMTLRKHFSEELLNGEAKRTAEVIMAMHRSAIGGNVAAQKSFLQRQGLTPRPVAKDKQRSKPLGKKEQLAQAAQQPPEDKDWGELLH